jgi:hypothetical protein
MCKLVRAFAALALACAAACVSTEKARPAVPSPEWNAFVEAFITETFTARPHHGVNAGRHEFDGKLPDLGADGLRSEAARLHTARDRVRAFDDASLDPAQRYERDYVMDAIDRDLFWLETMQDRKSVV